MKKLQNVPVIIYHTVSNARDDWSFRHLSCPVAVFESHLKALCRAGFQTISLHTLYRYLCEGIDIPYKSVVLTFDDGYFDNWVFAYPLLKKYGFQAVIFVNPEFVHPAVELRPTLEDVWAGRVVMKDLQSNGFLSWPEMREMEKSGFIDIQSHALTHTWYFTSPQIVDFHHPGDNYPWLAWNARPDRKHLWMGEDQSHLVPWGTPVYSFEKSLACKRYFPDPHLNRAIVDYIQEHGGAAYFDHSEWKRELKQKYDEFCLLSIDQGRMESDLEMESRYFSELCGSKTILENKLNKKIDFLCWPGGGHNDISARIAKEAGYCSTLHSSWDKSVHKNRPGHDPAHIGRIFPPFFHSEKYKYIYKGGVYLINLLGSVQDHLWAKVVYKTLRIPEKLRSIQQNLSLFHK